MKARGYSLNVFSQNYEGGDIERQNGFRVVTESLDTKLKRENFIETAHQMKVYRMEALGKRVTIIFVFLRYLRTYSLAIDLIYMAFFPALQIHISQVISGIHLCLLIHYKPFDES